MWNFYAIKFSLPVYLHVYLILYFVISTTFLHIYHNIKEREEVRAAACERDRQHSVHFTINPLLPNGNYSYRIIKISFSEREGIKKKKSYERRVYESVDDESLS